MKVMLSWFKKAIFRKHKIIYYLNISQFLFIQKLKELIVGEDKKKMKHKIKIEEIRITKIL